MNKDPLNQVMFQKMDHRLELDKEEGDYAYFHALTLKLEYVTKITTLGLLACVGEDIDRHRYTMEHRLVRADSIGTWVQALNEILVGPTSTYRIPEASLLVRDLTERVGKEDWRNIAVMEINQAAQCAGAETQPLATKVPLRQFFEIGVQLRNRTRGHGAITSEQCHKSSKSLESSLNAITNRQALFTIPWAYLHQSLSKKYRVSPLLGDTTSFDYLKRMRTERLQDGVYIYLERPLHIPLLYSDPDLLDISLPNGNHKNNTFESLSYVTNETNIQDGSRWSSPPHRLPQSETEGEVTLELIGENTLGNIPIESSDYVQRPDLEGVLQLELSKDFRSPIVTLTGPGGIGKTSIAISTIRDLATNDQLPYDVVIWISARDIDLLESGPKHVSPKAITQLDISQAAIELLTDPSDGFKQEADPIQFFQDCLKDGALGGATLFVLDNFETVQNPTDVFNWIYTHIRLPNKVLITTRLRSFVGDYPIEISGMSQDQAYTLIENHAKSIGVGSLVNSEYKNVLYQESDGHPYVMKILLGQVAKERQPVTPKRVVANSEDLLRALFERTFEALSLGGQRVFLLLCSWRVAVPEVAVEAVSLRSANMRFDVQGALDELHCFSLINRTASEEEGESFVEAPLAATLYGRSKLESSPLKVTIEEDRKLLMEFRYRGKGSELSIFPRIESVVSYVAEQASTRPEVFEERRPVLEYLAARVPKAYLQLAHLAQEVDQGIETINHAKKYLRLLIEKGTPVEKQDAWLKLVSICKSSDDAIGEIHALCMLALLPTSDLDDTSRYANRINDRLRDLKWRNVKHVRSAEVQELLESVITKMENHLGGLTATDCSRLGWLYANIRNLERALDVAKRGLDLEPRNFYCQNLFEKVTSWARG